ncbi:uncharacterized protein LOC116433200 [Nomia melanderi]|uniref:uncharacterized protein LOC116433200 n=1 Tax=Nomia melanderi TaxID=2448451 RepID=UPI003FCCAFB7
MKELVLENWSIDGATVAADSLLALHHWYATSRPVRVQCSTILIQIRKNEWTNDGTKKWKNARTDARTCRSCALYRLPNYCRCTARAYIESIGNRGSNVSLGQRQCVGR